MFNFVKNLKYFAGVYAIIVIIGIVMSLIFGMKMSIDFSGGSRFTYTYEGKVDANDAEKVIEKSIKKDVTVTTSKSLNEDSQKLVVTLKSKKALSSSNQSKMIKALQKKYADNKIEIGDSNTVSPTIAGSFFGKAIAAVFIAAILVIVYVGIRFRKIGGITAALTSLVALILDICISISVCVIFRLEFDANFIAVLLTVLGYSLNDTIVVYDRIRENKAKLSGFTLEEIVNKSINQIKTRSIITTVTTLLAIITILVVSEIKGLYSLRTFTIPMLFALTSGCISSLTIASPLWVRWQEKRAAKK